MGIPNRAKRGVRLAKGGVSVVEPTCLPSDEIHDLTPSIQHLISFLGPQSQVEELSAREAFISNNALVSTSYRHWRYSEAQRNQSTICEGEELKSCRNELGKT